jgi:hypothetical protein
MTNHVKGTAPLTCANHGTVAAHNDRGLLFRNFLNRVAQVLLMVQTNVGYHGNAAIPRVGRIKSPTETDLNDCGRDLFLAEGLKDCTDEDLKLCGWTNALFNLVGGIKGTRHRLGEGEWGERLPVDLDALSIADQVRLRGGGVAYPRRTERCGDEGNDAPLAVRSSDERTANSRFG